MDISHRLHDIAGTASGLFIWAAGVAIADDSLKVGGLAISLGMLMLGVSREVRCWVRGDKK